MQVMTYRSRAAMSRLHTTVDAQARLALCLLVSYQPLAQLLDSLSQKCKYTASLCQSSQALIRGGARWRAPRKNRRRRRGARRRRRRWVQCLWKFHNNTLLAPTFRLGARSVDVDDTTEVPGPGYGPTGRRNEADEEASWAARRAHQTHLLPTAPNPRTGPASRAAPHPRPRRRAASAASARGRDRTAPATAPTTAPRRSHRPPRADPAEQRARRP